jgi:CrcB protein
MPLTGYALVLLGAALGGLARYGLAGFVDRRAGGAFPFGTLAVNISGALAIGLMAGALGPFDTAAARDALFVYGFLGSYTTVSAFSLQTLTLARDHHRRAAMLYVAASLALCLTAAWLGYVAGGWL